MNETLRLEWLHPSVADPNPLNWRKHPKRQLAARSDAHPPVFQIHVERLAELGLEPHLLEE